MIKLIKKTSITILFIMCIAFLLCQSQRQSTKNSEFEKSDTKQITNENSTTCILDKTVQNDFVIHQVQLPLTLDSSRKCVKIENFECQKILQDPLSESASIIAIVFDDIIIERRIPADNSDNSIFEYYKYNTQSNLLTHFEGNVPSACFSTGDYAVVDGRIESVCESNSYDRIFYNIDLKNNIIEIQKTEKSNPDTESFYYNYSWDDNAYIQVWYDIDAKFIRYANISKCSSEGKINVFKHRKADSYAFSNQKIYELTTEEQENVKCVNILNEKGNLESTVLLPEVDDALQSIKAEYRAITDFKVIGNFILVNVRDEYQCKEMCFMYDTKQNTLNLLPECRIILPVQATDYSMETLYFYSIPSNLEDTINLYCIDATGKVSLLAKNLSSFSSFATDGLNIAYIDNSQLSFCKTF